MEELESDLNKIIFKFITNSKFMFYGLFLSEINKVFSNSVPTACIGKHPFASIPIMNFGIKFWKELKNDKQKSFVLAHETLHYVYEHWNFAKEFGLENRTLANIAFDIEINENLILNPELEPREGYMFIKTFPELNLEPNKNSLYYYHKLKKAADDKESSKQKGEDSKAGPKGNGNGTSGSQALDSILDNKDYEDSHKGWKELTEGLTEIEKEILARQICETLKRSAEETQKMKGDVPAFLEEKLNKIFEKMIPVIPWNVALRRFIGYTLSTEVQNNRKRPNRRYGEDAPAYKYKQKKKGIVLCDSSG